MSINDSERTDHPKTATIEKISIILFAVEWSISNAPDKKKIGV